MAQDQVQNPYAPVFSWVEAGNFEKNGQKVSLEDVRAGGIAFLREAKDAYLAATESPEQKKDRKTREARVCHFLLIDENRDVLEHETVENDQRLQKGDMHAAFVAMQEMTPELTYLQVIEGPGKTATIELDPEDTRSPVQVLLGLIKRS